MNLTDEDWKTKLSDQQYKVLREKGTEAPFSGKYLNESRPGVFNCAGCGATVFSSKSKYKSNLPGLAGWPSFSDVTSMDKVNLVEDNSLDMRRTEVICAGCGGHLGHVFDNDPNSDTGKHYCINSCSLNFTPEEQNG